MSDMTRKVHRRLIPGPAGKLEALLEPPVGKHRSLAAVVCHPHPLYGGTMHNKVVFHIAKTLRELGMPVLRFNFRGARSIGIHPDMHVGLKARHSLRSEGVHSNGFGGVEDARAAVEYLTTLYPQAAICLAGFSFGATVAMHLGAQDDRIQQLLAVGLPVPQSGTGRFSFLEGVTKPKLFIQGTRDEFGARGKLQELFDRLPEPKRLVFLQGAGHFLDGHLDQLAAAIRDYFGAG